MSDYDSIDDNPEHLTRLLRFQCQLLYASPRRGYLLWIPEDKISCLRGSLWIPQASFT